MKIPGIGFATAASAITILFAWTTASEARPRLDPRLESVRATLAGERLAGNTTRVLAARPDGPLPPGVKVLKDGAMRTLAIDVIMELDQGGREELLSHGITPRTPSGSFVTVTLTPEQLETVAGLSRVRRVEMAYRLKPYLDLSAAAIHATTVHGGPGPSFPVTGFTGRNVVVGIIDTGVDLLHDDFKKADGKTRIKYVWDQNNSAGPHPAPYNRGTEWSEAQINSGAAIVLDTSGHGTHVAGIAAGDGSATGNGLPGDRYVGIAPLADLIVVKTTFSEDDVLDAIDYIFTKAGSKDAVINLSLGTQNGPHDGTSAFDAAIANRVGPGRIIVAAAGNEANSGIHARLVMTPATDSLVFTLEIPSYNASPGAGNDYVLLDGWYEGTDTFSFVIQSPSGWRSREILNDNRLSACTDKIGGEGQLLIDNNNIHDVPSPPNGDREFYMEITDNSNGCGPPAQGTWKIIAYRKGATPNPGHIDLWITEAELGGSSQASPRFVNGADNSYLIGSPASATGVLSAGSYITRVSWQTQSGIPQRYSGLGDGDVGKISEFSSPGPLRNDVLAPTITAPGQGIGSARSTAYSADARFVLPDGKHLINQGTSQSCPHLTGTVALLLERCPHLSPQELFDRITGSADHDAFTGAGPNDTFGYGKLNALAAIDFETTTLDCAIDGNAEPDLGSTGTYTDPVSNRSRKWSVVSVPSGIATIVGSATGASVQVSFSGNGSTQLVLSVSDPADPEGCVTLCKKDIDVGTGFFSVLEAVSEPGQVRLHWHLDPGAPAITGFHVERAVDSGGPYTRITTTLLTGGPDFTFVDANAVPGQNYWYRIEAVLPEGSQVFGPLLSSAIPVQLFLGQNGPNPFTDETTFVYSLPSSGPARIQIFDLNGRLVRTLLDGTASIGQGQITWNGRNDAGDPAGSGIYFYRLSTKSGSATKKMMLLRH